MAAVAVAAAGGGGASRLLLVSPPLSRFPITSPSPSCCWSLSSSTTTVPACKSSSSSSSPPQTLSSYYLIPLHNHIHQRRTICGVVYATTSTRQEEEEEEEEEDTISPADDVESDPDPQDLEYISQIKRVLQLLKKNRDMLFSEVKLTIMIEDPRDVERRRLLGIDEADAPTRDDLAAVLEQVNEGKIPKNHVALQMLAEEMIQWPNLEVEASKKGPRKSLYAKATDTGVDPEVAAKRLNIDWDSAAEIEDADTGDDNEVPSAVGYGALYLVTAFPVIIGISVVLILFFNSLQ